MNKVAVLMSAYNGEKYLNEQLDSILAQKDVDVTLFIRDDGSSDSTVEIIKNYQTDNTNVKLEMGENIGVGNSFMQLIYDAGDGFDFYAFADQDDVWLPEKLSKAIEYICHSSSAILYASNQILVDGNLRKIGMRYEEAPNVSYMQIMCQNQVAGCTMVWNKKLHQLLSDEKRRPSPGLLKNRIHDVWVAMVAAVVGEIRYDSQGYMWYRQHDNNVVGVKKVSIIKQWKDKVFDPGQRNGRSWLCKEIKDRYGDILQEDLCNSLDYLGEYKNKLSSKFTLMKESTIINYSHESQFEFAIKVLLGLF